MVEKIVLNFKKIYIKYVIISVLVLIVIFIMVNIKRNMPNFEFKSKVETSLIKLDDERILYLTKIRWGVGSGHQRIILSAQPNEEYNTEHDYIFNGLHSIFYEIKSDSLIVHTFSISDVPNSFQSDIKVIQIELDNVRYNNLENNYTSLGLFKF